MNAIIISFKSNGTTYGILDTPCFPCRYYVGILRFAEKLGWHPARNGDFEEWVGTYEVAKEKYRHLVEKFA